MSTKLNVKLITDNLADELITRMQHASGIYSAPGTGDNLAVKVRYRLGSRNC